jgi:hypothetical protein
MTERQRPRQGSTNDEGAVASEGQKPEVLQGATRQGHMSTRNWLDMEIIVNHE